MTARCGFAIAVAVIGLAATGPGLAQKRMQPGDRHPDGGKVLYFEKVEIYNSAWRGVALNRSASGQADVYISGEGKTAIFDGVLSINCGGPRDAHFWKALPADDNGKLRPETVPDAVIANARRFFCPPMR